MAENEKTQSAASPYGSESFDGVTRQKTRCKIIVHSHVKSDSQEGKYNLERDVIQCSTGKTIKGGGGASFILVPRRNYINLIFPNDYVNIYFDVGDGRGFIRTFFGLVDRVNRSVNTDAEGRTTTRFTITCSDFTKIFDKTQLYFNPQIGQRQDGIGEFSGTANLGGVLLRTKGVTIHGSPADIALSLVVATYGLGSQWQLPATYTAESLVKAFSNANQKKRVEWAHGRLSDAVQKTLKGKTVTELEEEIDIEAYANAERNTDNYRDPTQEEIKNEKERELKRKGLTGFFDQLLVKQAKEVEYRATGEAAHILDLIDLRHIEWKTIDGYTHSQSIWQSEGSVWSVLNANSNEFVNELFCDLRPMQDEPTAGGAASGGKQEQNVSSGPYDTGQDELGENTGAVRYVPAIVMREYPFSTINALDPPADVKILNSELGLVYFGAVFSREPLNETGRRSVIIPATHEVLLTKGNGTILGTRSMDVVAIGVQDIISENIGRSDHDHVNLIEVYSDITSGQVRHAQNLLREQMPILSAAHIARHGLRVRRYTTRFGRFGALKTARAGEVDSAPTRKMLLRWGLLLDHWYQHNTEYLSGTFTTRALPEVRVGYRLDVKERRESYYVEGVNHQWQYPGPMTTTITVSRGQRNDPFPVYSLPQTKGFDGIRGAGSRLNEYFLVSDPTAVIRSIILGGERELNLDVSQNYTDVPASQKKLKWATTPKSFLAVNAGEFTFLETVSAQVTSIVKQLAIPSFNLVESIIDRNKNKQKKTGDEPGTPDW